MLYIYNNKSCESNARSARFFICFSCLAAFYANMPDEVMLTVNGNHPIYKNILDEKNADKQEKQIKNLADLALLSQDLLKGNDLTNFISRSVELMSGEKKSTLIVTE